MRILDKRNQEAIEAELMNWEQKTLKNIQEVSIDLWKTYKSIVNKLLPNAEVVADIFHVMKQINQEIDAEIKKQKRQATQLKKDKYKTEKLESIRNSKYVILKNYVNLNNEE